METSNIENVYKDGFPQQCEAPMATSTGVRHDSLQKYLYVEK